jgi:hypothetical protein
MRVALLVALALTTSLPALAQDDDPWGRSSSDDSGSDDSETPADDADDDAPPDTTPTPPARPGPVLGETVDDVVTGPGFGAPPDPVEGDEPVDGAEGFESATEVIEGAPVEGPALGEPDDEIVVGPGFGDTAAVPTPAQSDERGLKGGNVTSGVRIQPYGASTGVDLAQAFVVGSNGGTNQTTLRARYARGKYGVQVGLPFIAHRMPRQARDTGLGNLQLDMYRQIGSGEDGYTAIAVELHTNLGDKTYSWVHDADDIWPSTGLDVALQARRAGETFGTQARVSLGVRGGSDYAPWASSYLTFEVAFAVDAEFGDRYGAVGEMSVAYWDLSPWDVSGLVWVDISHGLRARGGFVFPLGVWTGMSRVDPDFRGVRETTAMLDLSLSL